MKEEKINQKTKENKEDSNEVGKFIRISGEADEALSKLCLAFFSSDFLPSTL